MSEHDDAPFDLDGAVDPVPGPPEAEQGAVRRRLLALGLGSAAVVVAVAVVISTATAAPARPVVAHATSSTASSTSFWLR